MKEAQIERWLNNQINSLGGLSFKFTSPDNPGVPDRIYIFPEGLVYFVELKTEIGRLANIQKWQGERLSGMGCNYRVIRGMEQAKKFIAELKTRRLTANAD